MHVLSSTSWALCLGIVEKYFSLEYLVKMLEITVGVRGTTSHSTSLEYN